MAFRLKAPIAKSFLALGGAVVGSGTGMTNAQLDAIPSQAPPLQQEYSDLFQARGAESLESSLCREDIRLSVTAVLAGKAAGEIYKKIPKQLSNSDFSLVKNIIGDAVEEILLNNPSSKSMDDLSLAISASGVSENISNRMQLLAEADCEKESTEDSWLELSKDHKCLICMDLLAAPVIIDCSHSFCGGCLHQYLHSENEHNDVVHFCPTCRVEIDSSPIYERSLDDTIMSNVNNMKNDCVQVLEWKQRREAYIQRMKSAKGSSLCGIGDNSSESDPFEDIESYIVWAIAFVAVMSIGVLSVLRRR